MEREEGAVAQVEMRTGQDVTQAILDGTDGDRLLGEDVLAGLDARLEVQRAEVGRRGQDHHVDAAGDDLGVGVEAGETVLGVDGDPAAKLPLQQPDASLRLVGEGVAHGDELRVRVGGQGVAHGAGAAPAAAHQPELQGIAARRVDVSAKRRAGDHSAAGGLHGRLEKHAPRKSSTSLQVARCCHDRILPDDRISPESRRRFPKR
jgi:hypothetical protein